MKIKTIFSGLTGVLPLALVACLLTPERALAQRPSVKPVSQVVVVDSKGKIAGHGMGGLSPDFVRLWSVGDSFPFAPTVLLKVGEYLVALQVARNYFFADVVYFDSANCQGTVWLLAHPYSHVEPILPQVATGPPGNTVYVPEPNAAPRQVALKSYINNRGGDCVPMSFVTQRPAIPGQQLIDLDTVFTPPFSVRTIP